MRPISELSSLAGRRALVVGGAGHLGGAAAETLVELGAEVAVWDVDEAGAAAVPGTIALAADLRDEAATRACVGDAVARLGGLDVLVHAAALVGSSDRDGWAVPFAEQSLSAWEEALRVNVSSAFVVAQAAAPELARSGHGSIILFGSIYGRVGPDPSLYEGTSLANPVAYGVGKGGTLQLMRYLATMLAPAVRVNTISPGGVERGQPDAFRTRYAQRTPLRRMATEEDVKGAVAFLASDLSAYVTGHDLVVDGGWTTW